MKRSDFFRGMWLSPLALVRGPKAPQDSSSTVDAQTGAALAEQLATTTESFNVRSFGAIGDGTSDDAAAIQAAIDTAEAQGGGIVFIPTGIYNISTTLTIDSNGVSIIGSTRDGFTAIQASTAGVSVFTISQCSNATIPLCQRR